jgi:hypothetical protein
MNIKQEYKENGKEIVNFTYVGAPRGVVFDGGTVIFRNGDEEIRFFISEIVDLIPYFEKWNKV